MTAPASQPLAGRFIVEREVGRGGVGIVFRAHDSVSGQPVALKVIALPGVDAGEEARFRREGRVLAGLHHPNIVRVVAFGQLDEGQPYVAMEWLEGEDLAQRQRRSPLDLARSLLVAAEVCEALAAAHAAGIVHRDVKPSNVLLEGSGPGTGNTFEVKLVDFGVATGGDAKLTRTGAIVGTPAYMAPEQARGDGEVDTRADLYALGATLFEMITGRPPHVGPTPIAILARLVTTPAPRLCEVFVDAPVRLDELMASLLATAPSERPASAAEVARELRAIHDELGTQSSDRLTRSGAFEAVPASLTTSTKGGGTRLITTIVATNVPKGAPRARLLTHLRARGADATELGGDAIVSHLGVRKALGDEALRALDLGQRIGKLECLRRRGHRPDADRPHEAHGGGRRPRRCARARRAAGPGARRHDDDGADTGPLRAAAARRRQRRGGNTPARPARERGRRAVRRARGRARADRPGVRPVRRGQDPDHHHRHRHARHRKDPPAARGAVAHREPCHVAAHRPGPQRVVREEPRPGRRG